MAVQLKCASTQRHRDPAGRLEEKPKIVYLLKAREAEAEAPDAGVIALFTMTFAIFLFDCEMASPVFRASMLRHQPLLFGLRWLHCSSRPRGSRRVPPRADMRPSLPGAQQQPAGCGGGGRRAYVN